MGNYTAYEWLAFFFVYAFLGWVWESCYVSVKQGKWVNRGFLRGPMLPIWCGYDAGCIHAVFGKLCADMDCRSDWGNGSGIHNRMGDGEDV